MEDVSIGSYHRVPQLLQFIHHPIGPFAFASLSALFKAFLTIGRSGFQHGVNDGKNLPVNAIVARFAPFRCFTFQYQPERYSLR